MKKYYFLVLGLVFILVLAGASCQNKTEENFEKLTNASNASTDEVGESEANVNNGDVKKGDDGGDDTITKKDMEESCAPIYNDSVEENFRNLQYRTSIYGNVPEKGSGLRLGIYQTQADYGPGASAKNLSRLKEAVAKASEYDVQLLAFPELYIPGYTLSPDEAKEVAEYSDGPSITEARLVARQYRMALIVPYAEKVTTDDTDFYYDSMAVINENGELLDSYKKTQLYAQAERNNWSFGTSDYPVHNIYGFPVGVLNCYEAEFPELSRILALNGAKLIVAPTAADNYYILPDGERSDVPYPDISNILVPANAYQNNIFFAYANRTGYEKRQGDVWHYKGNSIVAGPDGNILVEAVHEQDTMLIADLVPAYFGATHPEPTFDYLQDRRPDQYGALTAEEAKFYDETKEPITTETNLLDQTYDYTPDN
ncbi:carbon-nitrogen hydrolase family protein [Patescibacteria group bacterium]|nr:carbon-nitrogen hydrolase family protein [Patescibacteria group bacterium]MBU1674037.1 carbon-nitrogen hydrolase family protein [Patescibacteria group bacterium]MBU1963185.1 carbon-nitrogen hydrolase family protein [Patescibacteria group bacterium]